MMAFCFLALLRIGALLLSSQYFPLPLGIPSLFPLSVISFS